MQSWLDHLVALALPRGTFFRGGYGDLRLLDAWDDRDLLVPPSPAEVRWGAARSAGGVEVRDGSFDSPEVRLPDGGRTARIRRVAPSADAWAEVVLLAASGDQGFGAREAFARRLAARGVAAWLLENPYYGARRPSDQDGAAVRTVSDLLLMAIATVREALSLLALLDREGRLSGIAGYSMGGNLAALVAGAAPFPIAAVPAAPSCSPAAVFTAGLLRRYPDLSALGAEPERAGHELRERLLRFDATRLPGPRAPGACIVVGTRYDAFVPPTEMERLAAHWGCELRWLRAGHVSAVVLHRRALARAVTDALARLAADRGPTSRPRTDRA